MIDSVSLPSLLYAVTITIIPDAGYEIVDVVANGQSLGAVNEVTFKKVTKAPELLVITKAIG